MAFPILGAVAVGKSLYDMYQGSKKEKRANQINSRMLQMAEGDWNSRAPLRERANALAMMPLAQKQNLSMLYQSRNPFSRAAQVSNMPQGERYETLPPSGVQAPAEPLPLREGSGKLNDMYNEFVRRIAAQRGQR